MVHFHEGTVTLVARCVSACAWLSISVPVWSPAPQRAGGEAQRQEL